MTRQRRGRPSLSRRHLLRGAAGLAAGAATIPVLGACSDGGGGGPSGRARDYPLATPTDPVRIPIFDDNPPIESGLSRETAPVLKVLNYAEYFAPLVLRGFKKEFGAEVQVTAYSDFEELQRKLIEPGAAYDVVFAGPTIMSRMAYARLIQPFNLDYLPNLQNLWPEFQDPWYDQGAQYSTPYNVYTTGIGYRRDRVGEVPDNGYLMLWDPAFRGKVGLHDDGGSALAMTMLAWGITDDINTDNPDHINAARDKLIELLDLDVRITNAEYEMIPSGKLTVAEAWSGALTFASTYLTGDTTVDDIGYWVAEDRSMRVIGNETISVGKSAPSPVLAHAFINYLLDNKVAETNVAWTGYQPPLQALTADYLVEQEIFSEPLRSTIVDAEDFAVGLQYTEQTVRTENLYLQAWREFLNA